MLVSATTLTLGDRGRLLDRAQQGRRFAGEDGAFQRAQFVAQFQAELRTVLCADVLAIKRVWRWTFA